jgi:hypothetical protein
MDASSDTDLQMLFPAEGVTDDQYAAQINQLMTAYFNEPIRVGNVITYTLKPSVVCADEDTQQDIDQCTILLSKLALQQTLTSDTSGVVSLVVNGAKPISIGYAATEIYVEVDLAGIKSTLETLDPLLSTSVDEPLVVLPDTFAGAIRLTLGTPSQTSVSIKLGVTKAININGELDGNTLDMSLATSANMLVFTVTGEDVAFSMDMGAMSLTMLNALSDSATPGAMQISMGGLKANLSSDGSGDIIITNTGIPGSLSVKIGATENALSEILNVTLDEFDATLSVENTSIILDSNFDFALSVTDPDGSLSALLGGGLDLSTPSGLSVTASTGTEITMITDTQSGDMIPKVIEGSLTMAGTGALDGGVTATTGECLIDPGDTGDWMLEAAVCP